MKLEQYERILILAPHPDDEVLAAGGLIAMSLAASRPPQVQVVVVTDGDASYAAAWLNGHNPASRRSFHRLGAERREESRAALTSLGLSPRQIHFWGFPDRGLEPMWQLSGNDDTPYRSRTTGRTDSIPDGGDTPSPYTGAALLGLLRWALADFRPEVLVLPHPCDAHPDHRALARFTLRAVALLHAQGDALAPDLLAYDVWPGGLRRASARLEGGVACWEHLVLTPEAAAHKATAMRCYRSQMRPLGLLLRSRARRPVEVFARLQPLAGTLERTAT